MIPVELIHPMIVHFPIVFLLTAVLVDLLNLMRGGNIADGGILSRISLGAFVLGVAAAALAAVFGDIAAEEAVAKGVSESIIEGHEGLGYTTLGIFAALAVMRMLASWRGFELAGTRGWAFGLLGIGGLAVLITTAYFGGQLVFEHAVNVAVPMA